MTRRDINQERLLWGSRYQRLYVGAWRSEGGTPCGGQGQCCRIARTGGVITHPMMWFWSRSWGRFAMKTLNTGDTLEWITESLKYTIDFDNRIIVEVCTLGVEGKCGKCDQFGCTPAKGTNAAVRSIPWVFDRGFSSVGKALQFKSSLITQGSLSL